MNDDPTTDDAQERFDELLQRAREAAADRPDLDAVIERVQSLDEVDLARHPGEFDAAHKVLREALANAGREDAGATS